MKEDDIKRRQNLAEDLADAEYRKEYLHAKDHSLGEILRFIYKPVAENTKLVFSQIFYALTNGIMPLLSLLVVYFLVETISQPTANLKQVLIFTGIYSILFLLASIISTQLNNRSYNDFLYLRLDRVKEILNKFVTMDYGLYENKDFLDDLGNWIRSIGGDFYGIEGIYHRVYEAGGSFVSTILLAILLGRYSWLIVVLAIAFVLIFYFLQRNITVYKHNKREELTSLNRKISKLTDSASDFRYGKDLRLYKFAEKFKSFLEPLLNSFTKLLESITLREFQLSFIQNLALLSINLLSLLILVQALLNNNLKFATFVMLLGAVNVFSSILYKLAEDLSFVKQESIYVGDTIDILQNDLIAEDGNQTIPGEGPVNIKFENVSFSYPASNKLVLENLNLEIEAGERLALVGVNGAGKSTLVKLLTGLYMPSSGRILINGVDISTVSRAELFSIMGVVFQNYEPLALTVAENVAASDENIDRKRVVESLKTAGLWDKVKTLDKGIDQPVLKVIEDDGVVFSGGENQKLAIARALYRDSTRCMIMDEPTSALDALAEEKIYSEFNQVMQDHTAIFISHRLASTKFCDRIALLDGGKIEEEGIHAELMQLNGLYRQMYKAQAKYYQEEKKDMSSGTDNAVKGAYNA